MLHDEPLAEVTDNLRRGRTELDAYVEKLDSRAAVIDPEVQAFVSDVNQWERVRERASELDDQYPSAGARPPLYGVPVGVKDIFHVNAFETRAGSDLPPEVLTGSEGAAVARLRDAGAIILGKTETTEFASSEPGPTRNPHNTNHTPGGSSSGSAAAVASGLCPLALGTQTIGSIGRPAAFCGIVGVKPSYNRIPTDGLIPSSPSVDTVGYFTQDVEGAQLTAALLCEDWRSLAPQDEPTLGIPDGPYLDQATESGHAAFEGHVDRLAAAGYDIERVTVLKDISAVNKRHKQLVAAEMAVAHEGFYQEYSDQYADSTHDLIERGRNLTTAELARGRHGRKQLRSKLETRMDEANIDVWIAPAALGPAPSGLEDTGDPVMNLPWTYAGLPTVGLPAGKTESGLPLGIQCATRYGADEDLLVWVDGITSGLQYDRE